MAMILDAFAGNLMEKLTTLASEKAVMVLEVKEELERLQRRMARISKFLETAERRQLEDPDIKHWVGELKDVFYEADDIIDLCRTEGALFPTDDHRPTPSKKKLACFNFSLLSSCLTSIPHRYQIAENIKSLNEKLEEISKDRLQFNLEESREKQKSLTITTVNTSLTSSLPDLDVVGDKIEKASRELVKMIAEEKKDKCRFFAITGMGGIGKTTLAKKIFNDDKLKTDFQIKLWVCVSQSYNEIQLLQQVLRDAKSDYGEAKTKSELEPLLKSAVDGQSVFLVLDDVWTAEVWSELLRLPLLSGATILRILITTRNEDVARKMGVPVEHIRQVKQLSDETSWELLRRSVLVEGREEEIKKLADLGNQIVKKCYGLPLAVKAIGGVLKKEINRKEWEKVLNNEVWTMNKLPQELPRALYLSYDDLPSLLRQCFLYFSLFPEDKLISREDLVQLWVAEGFVKKQENTLLEEEAEGYYNELVRRNLLQAFSTMYARCTMHDLLRSLAMFLSQDDICFVETIHAATSTSSSSKFRRLSISNQEDLSGVEGLTVEQKGRLRTLLIFCCIKVLNVNQLAGLRCLRVLHIENSDIETIPNSIGDLIHLTYLNFNFTSIKELPESIGSLINLQFLNLYECRYLATLPKSITKLHNLRRLDLIGTSLNSFPKGISKLEKINVLEGFVVADPSEPADSYSSLEELNSLYQMRKLHISNMQRAQKGVLSLQKLTRLVELELLYAEKKETEEDMRRIEEVLEELCLPPSLEELKISNFFGIHYPSWMKSPSFGERLPRLTKLSLLINISCLQLPAAGELPELSYLSIVGASSVKSIGPEFLGTSTGTTFPNLRTLLLSRMFELEDWTFIKENEGFEREERGNAQIFPQLDNISIIECPKLKALPKGLEQLKIKKLFIQYAHSLRAVENLPNVSEDLNISNCQNLKRISHLPALQVLTIYYCPALNCVEKLDSLKELYMDDVVMDAVPEWMARLLQGRKPTDDDDFFLKLGCNEGVLRRLVQGGPDWPIIERIPRVHAYETVEGHIRGFLRYTRDPYNYETNLLVND